MLAMQPQDGLEKELCNRAFLSGTPISGTLELLPVCNMNCRMCYVRLSKEEMQQQGNVISGSRWLEIAADAAKNGTMFVLLTGGEPLLHPQFAEIYTGLRAMGMYVTINTNGTLLTPKLANLLASNLPRRVNISLYGTRNEVYDALCQNPKGFDQTMRGIQLLTSRGVPVKLNFTLTPQNRSELEPVMELSEKLQIPVSVPTYLFPPRCRQQSAVSGDFVRLTPQEAAQAQMELLYQNFHREPDYKQQLQHLLDQIEQKRSSRKNRQKPPPGGFLCSAGASSFWVNWKGELLACGMLEQLKQTLQDQTFAQAWSHLQQDVKKIVTSKTCFYCEYREICQTCAASAYLETGNFSSEVSNHCSFCHAYESRLKESR